MNTPPIAQDHYRSASTLAACASLLLAAEALVAALTAFSTSRMIAMVDSGRFGSAIPPGLAEAQDAQQRLLAVTEVGIMLVAVLVFLIWVYRANRNARSLGVEGMQYSPGWSVGWFLVPVASLFMPYFVLREIWKASSTNSLREWRQTPASPILVVWWAVSFINISLQYSPMQVVLGRMALAKTSRLGEMWLDVLHEFYWGRLISSVVDIAACVLTIVVITCVTDFQGRKRLAAQEVSLGQGLSAEDRPNKA